MKEDNGAISKLEFTVIYNIYQTDAYGSYWSHKRAVHEGRLTVQAHKIPANKTGLFKSSYLRITNYRQVSNIRLTLVGN